MKDPGWLWHGLAAAVLGAGAMYIGSLASVVTLMLVLGYLREQAQHGWQLSWPHQWVEALAWPVGGLLGALVARRWVA